MTGETADERTIAGSLFYPGHTHADLQGWQSVVARMSGCRSRGCDREWMPGEQRRLLLRRNAILLRHARQLLLCDRCESLL